MSEQVPAAVGRRRALVTILVGALAATGCATAGMWQWSRHQERSAQVAVVTAHQQADPAPFDLAPGAVVGPDRLWEPVSLTARYLGDPVLLRNRPVDGTPAYHVLGAVEVTAGPHAGTVLVVARGWLPAGDDAAGPAIVPVAPADEVELVVRLRPQERAATRAAPPGQVQTIHVPQVRDAALAQGLPATDWPDDAAVAGYAVVVTEDGVAPAGLGRLPAPSTELGPHLSYAFQWWVFALGAFGGAILLVVRERRENAVDATGDAPTSAPADAAAPARATRGRTRPARRRPTAEEEEDAILDAQDAMRNAPGR